MPSCLREKVDVRLKDTFNTNSRYPGSEARGRIAQGLKADSRQINMAIPGYFKKP